jgi:hypothetical protein
MTDQEYFECFGLWSLVFDWLHNQYQPKLDVIAEKISAFRDIFQQIRNGELRISDLPMLTVDGRKSMTLDMWVVPIWSGVQLRKAATAYLYESAEIKDFATNNTAIPDRQFHQYAFSLKQGDLYFKHTSGFGHNVKKHFVDTVNSLMGAYDGQHPRNYTDVRFYALIDEKIRMGDKTIFATKAFLPYGLLVEALEILLQDWITWQIEAGILPHEFTPLVYVSSFGKNEIIDPENPTICQFFDSIGETKEMEYMSTSESYYRIEEAARLQLPWHIDDLNNNEDDADLLSERCRQYTTVDVATVGRIVSGWVNAAGALWDLPWFLQVTSSHFVFKASPSEGNDKGLLSPFVGSGDRSSLSKPSVFQQLLMTTELWRYHRLRNCGCLCLFPMELLMLIWLKEIKSRQLWSIE